MNKQKHIDETLGADTVKKLNELIIDKNTEAPEVKENRTLSKAIEHYGAENQTIKAIEEMAELTKELAKALIGKANPANICEEIADVEIMVEQLKMIYDGSSSLRIEAARKYKLDRLGERIDQERENFQSQQ